MVDGIGGEGGDDDLKLFMKNISVIGAGTMGNGIAHVFAQNGFKVSIVDVSLAQLASLIYFPVFIDKETQAVVMEWT